MKTFLLAILLTGTVTFGGLYIRECQRLAAANVALAELRDKLDTQTAELEKQTKKNASLRDRLSDSRTEALTRATEAAQLQQALTNRLQTDAQTNNANPMADAIKGMLKDPSMKEMIKTQQRTALNTIVDKNYAKLFSDLRLSPEQATALKEMIADKMLAGADLGLSVITGDTDPTNRIALMEQIKATNDLLDLQIKNFLGDDNFAQYQSYEKTMNERSAVSGLKDQLAGTSAPLSPAQEEQLVQAMTQERQNFKFTTDFSSRSRLGGDFGSMFTEDKMNQFLTELDQLNQQYVARAQSILSPEQLQAYQKYLANQSAMQKMGMTMAAKMFGSKPAGN